MPQLVLGVVILIASIVVSIMFRRKNKELAELKEHLLSVETKLANDGKIKEENERLWKIIDMSPISYLLSVGGKVVEINRNMSVETGLKIGSMTQIIGAIPEERDSLRTRLSDGETISQELVHVRFADGSVHRSLVHISSIEHKSQMATVVWSLDMEHEEVYKEKLIATHETLKTVLDVLPIPVRIAQLDTKQFLYVNKSYMDLYEIDTPEQAYAANLYDLMPKFQENGDDSDQVLDDLFNPQKTCTKDMISRSFKGNPIDAQIVSCSIVYNGVLASLGIVKDLTSEKAHKQMLLNTAEKEKEANQLKSRFLANMSHEIRTPMNAIIGLTDIEINKKEAGPAMVTLKKVNASAKNLLRIINDILDFSKIEANKIELQEEEFSLEELLSNAMLVASPRLEDKNVEVLLNASLDLPSYVLGDRTRLWQILKNFLDNSAKYTENGRIVLTVYVENQQTDYMNITFIIEDTGIGIPENKLNEIFLPYHQVFNEAQKNYTTTGLGMPISKRLCEMMGGEMRITSQLERGTSIHMTIPFKRSSNEQTSRQAIATKRLAGKHVLIVDNDDFSRMIMEELLRSADAVCVSVHSGQDALDALYSYRDKGMSFDIVLMDFMMNGIDGMETSLRIQQSFSTAPKILMVTAYERHLLRSKLAENGIGDIIEKPFVPTQFINQICEILSDGQEKDKPEMVYSQFVDAKVLLCEDILLNQEVAAGMLAQFGVTPAIADNGKHAMEIWEETMSKGERFDMVFMDLRMPLMDGYETTLALREDPRCENTPIISLSADAMSDIVDRCREVGMNDHMAKPIVFDELHDMLMKWLPEYKRSDKKIEPVQQAPEADAAMKEALTRFGGSQKLYDKAMKMFLDTLPNPWLDFSQILDHLGEMKQCVHDIKGMSGGLGLTEVYRLAVEFEKTLRAGEPDQLLYTSLVVETIRLKDDISASCQDSSSEALESGSEKEFMELLDRLESALDSYDPSSCDEVTDELRAKTWAFVDEDKIEQLCGHTGRYEFFEAQEMLESLRIGG